MQIDSLLYGVVSRSSYRATHIGMAINQQTTCPRLHKQNKTTLKQY